MSKKAFQTTFDESILLEIKKRALEENKPVNEIVEKLILLYLNGLIKLD